MRQLRKTFSLKIWVICIVCQMLIVGSAAAQERMYVKSDTANIRMEPTTKSEKLWEVEKYHPLIIVEKKGQWYRFKDYQDDTAWIHSSLLAKGQCVITDVPKSNVRSEPWIAEDNRLFIVAKGVPFKVLESKGNWLKVKHKDGDIGWISKKLVW